ncbi:flavin reductase [Sphaerisporangium corydalis]|uniref:Flavin reductase n=1 Tax=Sphaerisporangium corydalis TaxID=1441875 RepID=A0ABV9EI49_9ACTN|nr:flavin reductase [Sphaerisporangium corydalis]
MGQLVAGVTVVTVRDGRDDIGTTVTTFSSLSADPPMVMLSLISSGYLCEVLLRYRGTGKAFLVTLPGWGSGPRVGGQADSVGRPASAQSSMPSRYLRRLV